MPIEADTIKSVFLAALDKATPAERAAYLDEACAGNPALRRRVEALLEAHDRPDDLLDQSAANHLAADGSVPLDFLEPTTRKDSLGRLGHYEVLEVVGQGGMGIVLRAFDEKLHRVVAIKVLTPILAGSSAARHRFAREARAAAAVTHDNVIAIHAVEDGGPIPYLVMQYVPGATLQDKLDRSAPLPIKEILRLGMQIADGLAAAHRQGLVHRDIKPANILLENGIERVKITDFGLARTVDAGSLTQSGVVAGTPAYMSPEQANGEQVDFRSDLFSLGSVLYALCAGHPPFRADTAVAILKRVCDDTPRPLREINPDVPPWLEGIVAKLQAKKPEDRFASATEVAALLSRLLVELQSGVDPAISGSWNLPRTRAASRKKSVLWLSGSFLALAAIAVAVWIAVSGSRSDDPQANVGPNTNPNTNTPQPAPQPAPVVPAGPVTLKPLRTLNRHMGKVRTVAYSPNGKLLASAGQDHTILLWDTTRWVAREIATPHKDDVIQVAFSPDGERLASVSYGSEDCYVRLWDVRSGKPIGTLGGGAGVASGGVWGVAWSPDGSAVAAGGWDRTLRVWAVASEAELLAVPSETERFIRGLGFSPKGDMIVTGGSGPTRVWDAKTGKQVPGEYPPGLCPTFLPTGLAVVGWNYSQGRVTICEVPSGEIRATWRAHSNQIEGLGLSPDSRFVATLGQDEARVWATEDQSEIATLTGHRGAVYFAAFSPDGTYLATAGKDDSTVRIWELPAICRVRK